jgi:hypothetical protein
VERRGEIYVRPANRLTDTQRLLLKQERLAMLTLLHICDVGVVDRRVVFDGLIAEHRDVVLPALVFKAGVPYARHICYSCADALPNAWGRCWRCSLAARLACRQIIPTDWFAAYDAARLVA